MVTDGMGPDDLKGIGSLGELQMVRELKDKLGYRVGKKTREKEKKTKKIHCIFCNSTTNIIKHKGKFICYSCYNELIQRV